MEWPAGVFGESLLAINLAGWCLWFLEREEQWEMLSRLLKK